MGTLQRQESDDDGHEEQNVAGSDLWQTGGGATWIGGTYDPETNLIYFGTGNPAPWNSHLRPGDNLYTASSLALNPDNGEIKWYFQTTPNDGWDFDGANEFVAFDMRMGQGTSRLAGKADRNGFFFVIDRTNGKFNRAFPSSARSSGPRASTEQGRPV